MARVEVSYLGHALVENRNGLIAAAMVTHADGYAERDAALLMLEKKQQGRTRRSTVGADKAYDTEDFVRTVAGAAGNSACDEERQQPRQQPGSETTRQPGYA